IYKLWREPAVQEFLQKPLERMPKHGAAEERMRQLERVGIKDAFVAIPAWQNGGPIIVGGFRFNASRADVEKLVDDWLSALQQNAPDAEQETVQHRHHRIEVIRITAAPLIATVYDRDWLFASSSVEALTALLDRADRRTADTSATLAADAAFGAASKRVPADYALFGYARLDEFFARAAAQLPQNADHAQRVPALRQIRSIAAATSFDNGKIRDLLFVTMPKAAEQSDLTRASLALATNETFLYLATMLTFPPEPALSHQNPAPVPSAGISAGLQRVIAQLGAAGISGDQWNSAFGTELGVIGDWPPNARIPALLATLPMKDAAKAEEIATTITATTVEGSRWAVSERDGVRYYSQPPRNPLLPLSPTLGLGRDRAIFGLDAGSVETAMKRAAAVPDAQLATTERFKSAEGTMHRGRQSFAYLDTAQLYTKLDAALRPMLIMGAAFVPSIAQTVDLNKAPAAEVITRHLSPIVIAQSYEGDGYLTASVGPVSIYHAALGIAAASGAGATWYRSDISRGTGSSRPAPAIGLPLPSPSPDDETP
ncbi:MAG TPA: hypothetical protein VK993_02155, partial [Chthoniobacterales bacterium]|nr:hypothetical protein [Chthoniobacterales bacterium]